MKLSPSERLDTLNIGLMLLSCAVAMIIPFELFLFSYAVLGPLHYLTEISWLHDKQYYAKGKWDGLVLLIIGLIATLVYFSTLGYIELDLPANIGVQLAYIALLSALVFALVKNNFIRIAGILLIILTASIANNFELFFAAFLPTLIHVYIFTGLFMLYGALKSKSRMGIASVVVLLLCPILLFNIAPNTVFFPVSKYGMNAYGGGEHHVGFISLHTAILSHFFDVQPSQPFHSISDFWKFWEGVVYHSKTGILIARFIAFAYTYHYLNWFSKTRIIQWHKVPRQRFIIVIVFWIVSLALYAYNYTVGLMWLFFLSYLHVLLEFPLNYTSIIGIGRFFGQRIFKSSVQRA